VRKGFRAVQAVLCLVLTLIVLFNGYNIIANRFFQMPAPKVLGVFSAVVTSGSMEPEIRVGDLIVARESGSYRTGDVAVYLDDAGYLITHRIVEETQAGYIFQGDANNAADSAPVPAEMIQGKVFLVIPAVGRVSEFLRSPEGILIVGLVFLLLYWLPSWMNVKRSKAAAGDGRS